MANAGGIIKTTAGHGVALPVTRDAQGISVKFDTETLPRAQNVMAADCATARLIHGRPTLLIGQLHPLRPTLLTRLLAVRYPRDQFVTRGNANEKFRRDTQSVLETTFPPSVPNYGAALFDQAEVDTVTPAVSIDCDAEFIVRSNELASITFLSISPREVHTASSGKSDDLWLVAPVEATMNLPMLVELLNSWKTLIEGMSNGR